MRRLLAALVFSLLAALAVPNLALATHSNGQGPAQDFVSGAATGPVPIPCPPGTAPGDFHANGQAQDNVTNVATGHFFTDITFDSHSPCIGFTSASFDGTIQCVNAYQSGGRNSANWSAVIDHVLLEPGDSPGIPGILFAGMGVISRHVDNGSPGVGSDSALGFAVPTPLSCNDGLLSNAFSTLPISEGNLIVHQGR